MYWQRTMLKNLNFDRRCLCQLVMEMVYFNNISCWRDGCPFIIISRLYWAGRHVVIWNNRVCMYIIWCRMGLWELHGAPPRGYSTMLCTTDLSCAPSTCVVHHGAQGGPMSVTSGGRPRHFSFFGGSHGTCKNGHILWWTSIYKGLIRIYD